MPKLNPYFIPKENTSKIEEVRYLDQNYQPQSYEEFMKVYEPSEAVEIVTEAEWQDQLLNGPQYGPGANQSKNEQEKIAATVGIGAGLVVTTALCPPLGGALSTFYGLAGTGLQVAGTMTDNDNLRDAGEIIGNGATVGGIAGLGASVLNPNHGCSLCKRPGGKEIWTLKR